eukprot:CAMPEP_0172304026 /NCGR_PEP_ID=MMETSP1058-20130122/5488_1 /TAXON_ID=83371 /ORGANISM="Detonula confervacea, Strain CCMP 353" /LENGTH=433 /DNA_ID=CAMNT_0013015085 /DNA_START=186 /DNA_END=1487 /DNA_ORIENTATION=+
MSVYLFFKKQPTSHEQLASRPSDSAAAGDKQLQNSTALNSIGENYDELSASIIPDSAAGNKNNSATPLRLPYEPPRIPRRLIFTYKYNLISPADNDTPFDAEDPLTRNVLHTIDQYKKYWEDAAMISRSKQQPQQEMENEEVVTSFLSDSDCIGVIAKTEPRLVQHFYRERKGEFKADICRAAELYLNGGYYFDIDIGVVEPLDFDALDIPSVIPDPLWQLTAMKRGDSRATLNKDDIVTFSTVYNRQGRFLQSFTAAMPRHPILKKSLEYMVGYYENSLEHVLPQFIMDLHKADKRQLPSRMRPGGLSAGYTLSLAYQATTDGEWEQYVRDIMEDHGYSSEQKKTYEVLPANRRYARFLYEISLEDEGLQELGFFQHVPLQDAEYSRKIRWCNYVCFGGNNVYFYSRVPGSRVCPLEKKFDDNKLSLASADG